MFVSPLTPICWRMDWQNFLASRMNHWPSLCGWPCLLWGDHATAAISMNHLSPSRCDSTSISQRKLMFMFCEYCFLVCFLSALYWASCRMNELWTIILFEAHCKAVCSTWCCFWFLSNFYVLHGWKACCLIKTFWTNHKMWLWGLQLTRRQGMH